jgi:cell division protein FtsB
LNSRRFIVLLYVVLLTGFGAGAGALLLEARAEYNKLKQDQAAAAAKLAAARTRLQEQQRILERLRTDPVFVEKVIRKELGYGRPGPGEYIFRFDSVR